MDVVEDYNENYVTGYVSIYRSIFHNPFWTSEKFTRGQAWIDLLLLAKYKDSFFYVRGVKVDYKRGDVTEGIINLSIRWKWSRNKTQNFINDLEKEQQIKQQKNNVITLISITNYDIYQNNDIKLNNRRTTEGQQKDTHNKVNKDNNIYSDFEFLEDWKKVREAITGNPTNFKKLNFEELHNFNQLKTEFTKDEFRNAIIGLFEQKNLYESAKLRPTHFLRDRNIEKYLDCKTNNKQLFK